MKFLSRKFFMTGLGITILTFMKFYDKLDNTTFAVSLLVLIFVYIFFNSAIKIQELKILNENFKIEIEEEENESSNNKESK